MASKPTDAERFERLYREHYAAVARFVHRRDRSDRAEDVVAETFAIAWRRFDAVPGDPLPWLYGVARNVLHGQRRATASDRDKAGAAAAVAATGGRDPADALAERDGVLRALATLPEGDREVLRLVAWEGLDQRDAARVLGTSRAAFAMRLSRARRRLTAALDADSPTDLATRAPAQLQET